MQQLKSIITHAGTGRSPFRTVLVVILATAMLAAGCTEPPKPVDTAMRDVNPFGWLNDAIIRLENADTVATGNLLLTVRFNSDLRTDRLPLSLEFTAPDSSRFVETRIFPLPAVGKNPTVSEVVDIPYRQGVTLSQTGCYTIRLKPSEPIHGIEAIGFTFQKQQ